MLQDLGQAGAARQSGRAIGAMLAHVARQIGLVRADILAVGMQVAAIGVNFLGVLADVAARGSGIGGPGGRQQDEHEGATDEYD